MNSNSRDGGGGEMENDEAQQGHNDDHRNRGQSEREYLIMTRIHF
jgi:hypothetical protein